MRFWPALLALVALLAGCTAPDESSDAGSGTWSWGPPPAACVEIGSWSQPEVYDALAGRPGVEERATEDLLASAPGDPSARIVRFAWARDDGLAFWVRSEATVVWLEGEAPDAASDADVKDALVAFLQRVTPVDEATARASADAFQAEGRARVDAPLRIEDLWQELGAPTGSEEGIVTWAHQGGTWEARWERALRQWTADADERPLVLRAELLGRVHAFSSESVSAEVAQPWLAKTFARDQLPLPEFSDWTDGTRPAC